jgi:hypothetical protein
MVSYLGRRISTDTDMGATGNGTLNQVGQIFNAMPVNGWLTGVGILGGKQSGQPNLTLRTSVFDVDATTLDARLIYTGPITVSNLMSFGGDGSMIEGTIVGLQLDAGTKYALAFSVTGGIFNYGMSEAAENPSGVSDYYFHRKNNGSSIPTDPFGATSVTNQGALAMWMAYEPNVKPTTTTSNMVPTGNINDLTPVFEGDWDDANNPQGDNPSEYQIQLRQVGQTTNKWNSTYGFSSTEKTNQRFTRTYEGSALAAGTSYEWRYRVSDQFGAWSDWSHEGSTWKQFTEAAGGAVSTGSPNGGPLGKQETRTPGPFLGLWTSGGGLSTDRVQVRLWKAGASQTGTPYRISPEIVKAVANNAQISVTWAETTFATLAWGDSLVYEMRARDTLGNWSEWSGQRSFTINAAPTTPSSRQPANGSLHTSRPLLRAKTTDADDTTGSGLSISVRIKNAAGTVLFTRVMTFNAGTGYFEYQTTATDLATFATYKWDAQATDGTTTSAFSSELSFTYANGPTVTVTAPTEAQVLTTNTPTITYTQNQTQVSHRLDLYVWDTVASEPGERVYWVDTTAQAAAAGAGGSFPIPAGVLHDGISYAADVTSINNVGLEGTTRRLFSVDFPTEPAPSGIEVSPLIVGNDPVPSAVLVSFPAYPGSYTLLGTLVYRRVAGTDFAAAQLLNDPLAASQTTFIDYYPVSGLTYTYSVSYLLLQGTDERETAVAEANAGVTLESIVINSATDGSKHCALRYGQPFKLSYEDDRVEELPWGQSSPRVFGGDLDNPVFSGTVDLHNDRFSLGLNDLQDMRIIRREPLVVYRDWYQTLIVGSLRVTENLAVETAKARLELTIRGSDGELGAG